MSKVDKENACVEQAKRHKTKKEAYSPTSPHKREHH